MKYKGVEAPVGVVDAGNYIITRWKAWINVENRIKEHKNRIYSYQVRHGDRVYDIDLSELTWRDVINRIGVKRYIGKNTPFPEHLASDQQMVRRAWEELQELKKKRKGYRMQWDKYQHKSKPRDLLDNKHSEIIELFGRYKTLQEVREYASMHWATEISLQRTREFFYANETAITKERQRYEKEFNHIPLTQSKGRIEQYAYLYDTQRQRYKETNHPVSRSQEMRAILSDIRKEIHGDRIILDVQGKIDVEMTVNVNQSLRQIAQEVPILSFIIATVASKKGINPTNIMNLLQTSIYSHYSGVSGVLPAGESQDLTLLPSNQVYDWITMSERAYGKDKPMIHREIQNEGENQRVETNKQNLLAILREKQKKLS